MHSGSADITTTSSAPRTITTPSGTTSTPTPPNGRRIEIDDTPNTDNHWIKDINFDLITRAAVVYNCLLYTSNPMHYCPGCSHGVVHKLIAEVIEEMGMEDKTIGVSPVGCAVFAYNYLDIDWQEAAHGRAPAVATAIKRLWPGRLVFTYQGDGDLACIGTAETIHALNRGENITIIFINNAIYGMTGGQMAPTTLVGMKTATCPYGRDVAIPGYPLKMTEIAATLEGTAYVTRTAVHTVPAIRKAKKAIRKARCV